MRLPDKGFLESAICVARSLAPFLTLTSALYFQSVTASSASQVEHDTQVSDIVAISAKFTLEKELSTDSQVVAVAWSEGGGKIAAVDNYGAEFWLWNKDGKLINSFSKNGGGPNLKRSLAFIDSDKELVFQPPQSAPPNTLLSVWDVNTTNLVKNLRSKSKKGNPFSFFAQIHGSQDVVYCTGTPSSSIVLIDTTNGQTSEIPGVSTGVFSVSSSGNGDIVVGSNGGSIDIMSMTGKDKRQSLRAYKANPNMTFPVSAVAVSPDGHYVAAGLGVGLVMADVKSTGVGKMAPKFSIIDAKSNKAVFEIREEKGSIESVEWDRSNHYVAALDTEGNLYIVTAISPWKVVERIKVPSSAYTMALSPDGEELAVGVYGGVLVYSLSGKK